jgi:hypothetical protein
MDASKLEENRLVRVHFLAPAVAGGCIGKAQDYEKGDVADIPLSDARYLAPGLEAAEYRAKTF